MEEENEGSKEKYVKIFKPLLQNRGFLLLRIVWLISFFVYILVLFLLSKRRKVVSSIYVFPTAL